MSTSELCSAVSTTSLLGLLVMLIPQGTEEQDMTLCSNKNKKTNKINGLDYFSSCQPCGNVLLIQLTNTNQRGVFSFSNSGHFIEMKGVFWCKMHLGPESDSATS